MNEINATITQLKEGKRIISRHQEDEWGIDYAGENTYKYWWSTGYMADREIKHSIIDERRVREILGKLNPTLLPKLIRS